MPVYRIHRMKDAPRQQFRWAPHVGGEAQVRAKDYEEGGQVTASNEYHAWRLLREAERPLDIGDLLETEQGGLRICKYVGFEAAQWVLPEVKLPAEPAVPVLPN